MEFAAFLPYLTNGGVAIVVFMMIVAGALIPKWAYTQLKEENRQLKEALTLERSRGDAAVAAAQQVRDVLIALRGEAALLPPSEKVKSNDL